jgi:hypothetical protein
MSSTEMNRTLGLFAGGSAALECEMVAAIAHNAATFVATRKAVFMAMAMEKDEEDA